MLRTYVLVDDPIPERPFDEADGEVHGYELTHRLAERGLPVAEGSAYPLLARLERGGLLRGETRAGEGRPRTHHAITAAGRHALAVGREERVETSDTVRAARLDPPVDQDTDEETSRAR